MLEEVTSDLDLDTRSSASVEFTGLAASDVELVEQNDLDKERAASSKCEASKLCHPGTVDLTGHSRPCDGLEGQDLLIIEPQPDSGQQQQQQGKEKKAAGRKAAEQLTDLQACRVKLQARLLVWCSSVKWLPGSFTFWKL